MKSLDILRQLLVDAQSQLRASTNRDWKTIQRRYEHEGQAFLGLVLPTFSEWLEESLREGSVAPWIYSKFRKKSGGRSVLPCFLHGLTALVFDAKTGLVLDKLDESAVFFIRQICLFHKKLFYVCDAERLAASISSYEQIDLSLRRAEIPSENRYGWDVDQIMSMLNHGLETAYCSACDDPKIRPKHGPGATADRQWANGKYRGRGWLARWRGLLSWEELYGFSTVHQAVEGEILPNNELPAKVVAVPKTMKTARIICVEPTAMQYAQQLVSARLRAAFKEIGVDRQLNLTDQAVNQRLAKEGSKTGQWATLDLSEASDRLHSKVVGKIFRRTPRLRSHLFGCRTSRAVLPDGRVLPLMKYASMGSALTFPVEAFCFYVIAVAAVYRYYLEQWMDRDDGTLSPEERNRRYRHQPSPYLLARKALRQVFVFGDDIIVPVDTASLVIEYLERYLLKVNTRKSFFTGPFRESCGHDYVNGILVSPVYLRRDVPQSTRDGVNFTSWVSMCNQFHLNGCWHTAEAIRSYLDSLWKLPMVTPECEGLGYVHYTGAYKPERLSKKTGDWVVRTLVPRAGQDEDLLVDYDALLAAQIRANEEEQLELFPVGRSQDRSRIESPKRNSLRLRPKMVSAH